jgi:type II secretory pathway component GspD/PulD (secretin)/tetratricopeptide (TPR) repeat protein
MRTRPQSRIQRLVLAAGIAVSTLLIAEPTAALAGSAHMARDVLDQGVQLLDQGKLLRAKRVLADLNAADLTPADRVELINLRRQIDREVNLLTSVELSLQKAEVAMVDGDLRTAERHANAVMDAPGATGAQRLAADELLDGVDEAREVLAARVDGMLAQAAAYVDAGDYAEAKPLFATIDNAGVQLTDAQADTFYINYDRVLQYEIEQGIELSSKSVLAAMMQPGRVVKTTQPEDPPTDTPEEQPAEEPPAEPPAAEEPPPAEPVEEPVTPVAEETAPTEDLFAEVYRIEALSTLTAAEEAFLEGRWSEAIISYNRVLSVYSSYLTADEVQQAQANYERAQAALDRGDIIETTITDRQIAAQAARDEFATRIQQAEDQLAADETQAALTSARAALTAWQLKQDFLSDAEYQEGVVRANDLITRIEQRIITLQEEQRQMTVTENVIGQQQAETRARLEQQRRINEALNRVQALQAEQRYEEALQVIQQIKFDDPGNPTADILERIISDVIGYRSFYDIQDKRRRSYAREALKTQELLIAPPNVLDFPDDWPELSTVRGPQAAYPQPAEDRRVSHILDTQRLPFEFDDNMLDAVFTYIENLTPGINFNIDWISLDEAGVTRETPISLSLQNVPIRVGLERVLEQVNSGASDDLTSVGYSIRDGIITIAQEQELRKYTIPIVYDIRDLLIDIPDHEDAPDLNLQTALQQAGEQGGGGGANIFGGQGGDDVEAPTEQELTDQIVDLIIQTIDPNNWVEAGGETGTILPLRGNLIINQTPENHIAIEGLLAQLREVRSMQVNIEARFLSVAQDWFEQIGFDLDVIWNAQNNQYRDLAAQNPSLLPSDLINQNGTIARNISGPASDILIAQQGQTGTIGTITLPDGRQVFTNIQAPTANQIPGTTSPVPAPEDWSIIPTVQNSLGLAEGLLGSVSQFGANILTQSPALAVGATFLDDIQVDLLIKATQADRRTVTLTAPRLTVFNGQRSYIQVAVSEAFVSDLQPVTSESAVGFDPETSSVSSGVVLDIEATVSADRRYVTMHVDAQLAEVTDFRTVPVTATAGNGQIVTSDPNVGNRIDAPQSIATGFIELPEVQVSRVVTSVSVPDKGTILLGGQRLLREVEVETGVPVLSKIPVINRFFTNRISSKDELTLLILLRPQIIIQNEEEERNFPGLRDSLRASGITGI